MFSGFVTLISGRIGHRIYVSSFPTIDAVRDATLQKIGRNVVKFQKMEAMLRYLLTIGKVHGPLSEFESQLTTRRSSFAKLAMGELVSKMVHDFYADDSDSDSAPAALTEPSISFSVTLEGGKDSANAWRKAMILLVQDRNALIHRMIASFDPQSIASCERLSQELDAQNARLIPAYAHLQSLVLAIKGAHGELLGQLDGLSAPESSER